MICLYQIGRHFSNNLSTAQPCQNQFVLTNNFATKPFQKSVALEVLFVVDELKVLMLFLSGSVSFSNGITVTKLIILVNVKIIHFAMYWPFMAD
jgi:hypothetical protein